MATPVVAEHDLTVDPTRPLEYTTTSEHISSYDDTHIHVPEIPVTTDHSEYAWNVHAAEHEPTFAERLLASHSTDHYDVSHHEHLPYHAPTIHGSDSGEYHELDHLHFEPLVHGHPATHPVHHDVAHPTVGHTIAYPHAPVVHHAQPHKESAAVSAHGIAAPAKHETAQHADAKKHGAHGEAQKKVVKPEKKAPAKDSKTPDVAKKNSYDSFLQ